MITSVAVALALFGAASTASSLSAGTAKVVNKCSYEVYLCNVPAEGGGYSEEDKTLSPGDSYSQTYTELSNGQGWSIKLSNSTSLASILQYEYTFHNDGIIWFDLSCVNGDPWPENWEIAADNGCDPKQTAYRYPTDDDYGMQACSQDASVEVTLCASESSGNSSGSSSSASAPSYSSVSSAQAPVYSASSSAQAPAYTQASSSAASTTHTGGSGWFSNKNGLVEAADDYAPATTPTTLATVTSKAADGADATVVDVAVAYQTAYVTVEARDEAAAPGRHRRHEHHAHGHHA